MEVHQGNVVPHLSCSAPAAWHGAPGLSGAPVRMAAILGSLWASLLPRAVGSLLWRLPGMFQVVLPRALAHPPRGLENGSPHLMNHCKRERDTLPGRHPPCKKGRYTNQGRRPQVW